VIHKILPLVLVASAGFAAAHVNSESAPQGHHAQAAATPETEIAALRDELAHLTNRVNHLETEIKASNPEGEYKQMTIDSVRWTSSAEPGFTMFHGREHELELMCHVAEWSGYPRMLRFTRKADHQFYLEAADHKPVEARMNEGGITDDSGSMRFVVLTVNDHSQHLEPGVQYSIRPRNDSADYKWIVPAGVVVPAK
jgi:hypothetical protein